MLFLFQKLKPPSPSFNYHSKQVRRLVADAGQRDLRIIDLGSGRRRLENSCINIDIIFDPKIDVVARAEHLPFVTESIDLIICSALLEHVRDPGKILRQVFRGLKVGGHAYIEVPFLQTVHTDKHFSDYRRYTLDGIVNVLSDFTIIQSGASSGPFSVLAWLLRKGPLVMFKRKTSRQIAEFVFGWSTFWIKYLDWFLKRAPHLEMVCGAVYVYAQKTTSCRQGLGCDT